MTTRSVSLESPPNTAVPRVAAGSRRQVLRSAAFWLVVLAFAVRIGFMLAERTYRFEAYRVDDYSYRNETTFIARTIAEGRGFSSPFSADYTGPTSWIGPVYPYLCAAFFVLFGPFTTQAAAGILVLQSLFSALTCVPILGIADRIMDRRAGLAAALLWAIFPWFSKWAVSWVWEVSLSTLLFACLIWYALRLAEPASVRLWVGFGALWGFALLVNPALLLLLPVSLLWCGYRQQSGRSVMTLDRDVTKQFLIRAVVAGGMSMVVISPWLVRNRVVFGQWTFLRSNFGFEFWLGNARHASQRGWFHQHPAGNSAELELYRSLGEPAYVHAKMQDALAFARQEPREFLDRTAQRTLYFWDGSAMGYRAPWPWYWMPWSFVPFNLLMLPALLVAHRRGMFGWPLFLSALLLYPLPYYVTYSQVRYRHVLEPLMLLLLCFAVSRIWVDRRA